jgi:hypothetical protein
MQCRILVRCVDLRLDLMSFGGNNAHEAVVYSAAVGRTFDLQAQVLAIGAALAFPQKAWTCWTLLAAEDIV